MSDVVFALRRNASTDPPDPLCDAPTDQGQGYIHERTWYEAGDNYSREVMDPQPSCWYDLRPSDEPLTTEALERIHAVAIRSQIVWMPDANALRAALDALTKQSPPDQSGG